MRRRSMLLAFAVITMILACIIPVCALDIYFFSPLDPCLSTILAPREVAAIRTRYQDFYALMEAYNYEQAYQYTSTSYRSENDLAEFEQTMRLFFWGPRLTADSFISVCGDRAHLRIAKYGGDFHQRGWFWFSRQEGQWYLDDLRYVVY